MKKLICAALAASFALLLLVGCSPVRIPTASPTGEQTVESQNTPVPVLTPVPSEVPYDTTQAFFLGDKVIRADGKVIIDGGLSNATSVGKDLIFASRTKANVSKEDAEGVVDSFSEGALFTLDGEQLTEYVYSYFYDELSDSLLFGSATDGTLHVLTSDGRKELLVTDTSMYAIADSDNGNVIVYGEGRADIYNIEQLTGGNKTPLASYDGVQWVEGERFLTMNEGEAGTGNYYYKLVKGDGTLADATFYRSVNAFHEGLAATCDESGNYGYIDESGEFAIEPKFSMCGDFSDGLASVCLEDGLWGYIDRSGEFVIQPQFVDARAFSKGYAGVTLTGNVAAIIDTDGNVVGRGMEFYGFDALDGDSALCPCYTQNYTSSDLYVFRTDGTLTEVGESFGIEWDSAYYSSWLDPLLGICSYTTGNEEYSESHMVINVATGEIIMNGDGITSVQYADPALYGNVGWRDYLAVRRDYKASQMCQLLNRDGDVIIEANEIYSAGIGVYAVKNGFSRGLIDVDGNWIYEESVFDSFEYDD